MKIDNFRRKFVKIEGASKKENKLVRPDASGTPNSSFENDLFSTKIGELEAHSLFENGQFLTKIGEIEAHSSFENGQFSTKIC